MKWPPQGSDGNQWITKLPHDDREFRLGKLVTLFECPCCQQLENAGSNNNHDKNELVLELVWKSVRRIPQWN